jgi:hypothetical protein
MKTPSASQTSVQVEFRDDYKEALFSHLTAGAYTPSPVLVALNRLLVKNKTIAKALHVSTPFVSMMLAGRKECPVRHEAKLFAMLRDAVDIGKKTCRDAESGKFRWGDKEFPRSAISFIRERIAEAEGILATHEKEKSQ